MQTVILAGGAGNRAYPLSLNKPKPMFKILGKPLLHYVIENLKDANLKDLVIVTGHHANQVKDYFGDGSQFGVNIQYTYQDNPFGMAHALQTAKNLIDDSFLVINGDDMFDSSLIKKKIQVFQVNDAELLFSCKPVKETWKFGILKTTDDNRVEQIVEKPIQGIEPSNLAVVGAYILPTKIFDYFDKVSLSDSQLEIAIQKFIDDGNIAKAVTYDGIFSAYKYPWDLFEINQYLMDKHLTKPVIDDSVNISEKSQIEGNVWISKGSKVLGNATIRGPCYIGENSMIGTNALIWNYSSIGNNSVIGFSTEIKNSLIGENCWFHTNYIGDSIIGDNCSFGSGAVTANFRFDEEAIKVNIGNKKIESGRNKLGVIMADKCKVGVNATLCPGLKIGPDSIVGPSVCLMTDLEPNKIILINKENYIVKENKINISSGKHGELRSRLKQL